MASFISVRVPNSTPAEDVNILADFNAFVAAVRSHTAKHVDCGGTVINNATQGCDELIPADVDQVPGTTF